MLRKSISKLSPVFFKKIYAKLFHSRLIEEELPVQSGFNKSKPEWFIFEKGILEDLYFYLDKKSSLYSLFYNGHDDFIYKHADLKKEGNKIFYDIGAHFGYHTLGFSKLLGSSGEIYSFEPHPMNIERLKNNIIKNKPITDNVKVLEVALTNFIGEVDFDMIYDLDSGWSSASKFTERNDSSHDYKKVISVTTDTIDNLIDSKKIPPPDIIKIDVEGEEYNVLLGGRKALIKYKPQMFIEIHNIEAMFNVDHFLSEVGYHLTIINKEKDGRCFIKAFVE